MSNCGKSDHSSGRFINAFILHIVNIFHSKFLNAVKNRLKLSPDLRKEIFYLRRNLDVFRPFYQAFFKLF